MALNETTAGTIQKIDNGLAGYYRLRGRTNYHNEDGVGKFQYWADENGYEDDQIIEDLEDEDEEPAFVEFDEDFPFENKDISEEDKPKEIVAIVRKCFHERNPYDDVGIKPFPDLPMSFFDLKPKEVDATKKKYSNECASIMNQGMADDAGLFDIITAGQKNKCDEFIQHLVDTFARDRIRYFLEHKDQDQYVKNLDISTWSDPDNSPLFKRIQEIDESAREKTLAAIRSFYKRMVPKLLLNGNKKIQGYIEQTATYIVSAAHHVHNLADKKTVAEHRYPFQMDVIFGYPGACDRQITAGPDAYDAHVDEEEDDDDRNDIYHNDEKQQFFDCIGNIKDKLNANKLEYIEHDINPDKQCKFKFALGASGRIFKEPFDKLCKRVKDHKSQIGMYPESRRLNIFIDLRDNTTQVDKVYMFEPPDNCKCIPTNAAALWYLAASRTTLIPDMKYDGDELDATNAVSPQVLALIHNDKEEKKCDAQYWCTLAQCVSKKKIIRGMEFELIVQVQKKYYRIMVESENQPSIKYKLIGKPIETEFDSTKQRVDKNAIPYKSLQEKLQHQNITSYDHCKGGILTVSFHAIEEDHIKCYLYFNGQMTRFIPESDLKDVLPLFFDETMDENKGWSESVNALQLTNSLHGVIRDREFESFYKKYRSSFNKKTKQSNFI